MASKVSIATGNFTTAGTWGTVDATSLSDSEAANTALTTSYQTSSTFTPGAITISGLAVKLATRNASPTGTITVALDLATVDVAGTVVTVNVSDLQAVSGATNKDGGWYVFTFATPVLLVAATAYGVKAKTSSSSQVNLFSTATTNWSRMLITTTTGVPGAADDVYVLGQFTAAGASNTYTVTMDSVATTKYGQLVVGVKGALTYGTAASTAYYLKIGGNVTIHNGGTINVGTNGTAIPSTSSAVFEMSLSADRGFAMTIKDGGTFNLYGNTVTTTQTTLTANAAATDTSLTVGSTTGWVATDEIVVAATTRTATEAEIVTITTVTDGTHVAVPAITNAHSGTSPTIAEIGHLTRNVIFRTDDSTKQTYITTQQLASMTARYTMFRYLTNGTVSGTGGIEAQSTTSTFDVQFCVLRDFSRGSFCTISVNNAALNNITFSNNVIYNCGTAATSSDTICLLAAGSVVFGASCAFSNNLFIKCVYGSSGTVLRVGTFALQGITMVGNVVTSATGSGSQGVQLSDTSSTSIKSFTTLTIHSNNSTGFATNSLVADGTYDTFKVWRNNSIGISWNYGSGNPVLATFATLTAFGNNTAGFQIASSNDGILVFTSPAIYGGTTLVQPIGISCTSGYVEVYIRNGTLGSPSAHSTSDLNFGGNFASSVFNLYNTTLATTTEVNTGSTAGNLISTARSQNHDASSSTFKAAHKFGVIASETTTRHTASGYSWKLTPNSATNKLILPGPNKFRTFKTCVNASQLVTISAYLQKDASYNGNAARLVLLGGMIGGIASDVTASMTVASGNWELLTVTGTPNEIGAVEFYIDCDGTAGNIYVDDLSVSQAGPALPSTGNLDTPVRGLPPEYIYSAGGGLMVHPGMGGGARG